MGTADKVKFDEVMHITNRIVKDIIYKDYKLYIIFITTRYMPKTQINVRFHNYNS